VEALPVELPMPRVLEGCSMKWSFLALEHQEWWLAMEDPTSLTKLPSLPKRTWS
jgi:hypothetical protein